MTHGTVQPLKVSVYEVTWIQLFLQASISIQQKTLAAAGPTPARQGPLKLLGLTRHQQTKNEEQQQKNLRPWNFMNFTKANSFLKQNPELRTQFQDWDAFFVKRQRSSTLVFLIHYILATSVRCFLGISTRPEHQ